MDDPSTTLAREATDPAARRGRWRGLRRVLAVLVILALGSAAIAVTWMWAPRRWWTGASRERAEALISARRFAAAGAEAEAYLQTHPDDPRTLMALGRARAGARDLDGCVRALDRVPEWSILKSQALLFAGKALMERHRAAEAERRFRACIAREARDPGSAQAARLELLPLLAREERLDEFRALVWETYARVVPADRMIVLTMRMRIEFERAMPESDARALRAILAADPRDYQARAGLATVLDHQGKLPEARAEFAQALVVAPDDPAIRERYLDLLHRLGGVSSEFRAVLAARPAGSDSRPEMLKYLGLAAEARGDLHTAESAYARIVALAPEVPEYHHRLSQVLYRLGRRAEAERQAAANARISRGREELRKAWDLFANAFEAPTHEVAPALVRNLARACAASDLRREAIAWYRELLRLAPDDPDAPRALEVLEHSPTDTAA